MKKVLSLLLTGLMFIGGCSCNKTLPKATDGEFDAVNASFGVDKNINISTIDEYLNLEDVVYRDMRLLVDSEGYDGLTPTSSGMLTATVEGFKISPLPYIVNLWDGMLPPAVKDDYAGKDLGYTPLFNAVWSETGQIQSITPNYEESMHVLEEIFPHNKSIFVMCGGSGYAWMTKQVLLALDYDSEKVYNIGGFWAYTGDHKVDLVSYYDKNENGLYEGSYYSFYNAYYMAIDTALDYLTPIKG